MMNKAVLRGVEIVALFLAALVLVQGLATGGTIELLACLNASTTLIVIALILQRYVLHRFSRLGDFLHILAAVNAVGFAAALVVYGSPAPEDLVSYAFYYPVVAYGLTFAQFATNRFRRARAWFGIGLALLFAIATFTGVGLVATLIGLNDSDLLDLRMLPPLQSALVVATAAAILLRRHEEIPLAKRMTLATLLVAGVVISTGTQVLRHALMMSQFEVEITRVTTASEVAAHRTENELLNLVEALERMADRIAVDAYPSYEAWQQDADNYVSGFESLLAMSWMSADYNIHHSSPPELLESSLLNNIMQKPAWVLALEQARDSKQVTISAPFQLDGMLSNDDRLRVALIAPILREAEIIGYLAVGFDLEALFEGVIEEIGDEFPFVVWDKDILVFAYGDAQTNLITKQISAFNRTWELSLPVRAESVLAANIWGQRFALSRVLAVALILFAIERTRLAWRQNRELSDRLMELSDAYALVKEQEYELSLMRASLAHDLKSPIRNIRTATSMWEQLKAMKGLTDDELKARILENTKRLENLTSTFTTYLGTRLIPVQSKDVDLQDLLRELAEKYEVRCNTRLLPGADINLHTDPALVERIVENLIENAVKHGGRNTMSVTLSAAQKGGQVEISVHDNGQGVPADLRKRIFDPFDVGDGKKGPEASGLGLAIVRRLAQKLDGMISCEDPGAAGGALFVLRLPLGA
ncbi:sensor histidine kinase [Donghicola tyrosinivorans]|uniref:histidine kinase n=1 Tax=Donghicola tyrosinivorans TaxID=1652492 RepID=A0A2T0WNJ6_9RHOB|nr:ATP-binding protein [Donghicola tyrosinivorans]PRY88267.1 CHASE domain-containing protein [Donghicola tyrosinivorans]